MEYNSKWGRAGRGGTDRDQPNTGGQINTGRQAGGPDGYVFSYFFCSFYSPLLLALLLYGYLFFCGVQYNNRRGRTGRERRGRESNAGKDGGNGYVFC